MVLFFLAPIICSQRHLNDDRYRVPSSDGTVLTVSVFSADPSFMGAGTPAWDYIQLSRGDSKEPFKGEDFGAFGGSAEPVTCTTNLLHLPSTHD